MDSFLKKYSRLFSKFNDDHKDINKIIKACIYLPNEGLIMNKNCEVFYVNNTGYIKLDIFSKKKVIEFAYAKSTDNYKLSVLVLVLTENEVFGFGANEYRQISFTSTDNVLKLQRIKIPLQCMVDIDKFISISCVYGHCMALTSKNCVILWGNNSHGQIGNGTTGSTEMPYRIKFKVPKTVRTEFKEKRIIECKFKIKSIACSARNSYVLLANGDVYGWGENSKGQVGTLHVVNYSSPHVIYGRIKQFVARNSYALALRNDGTLFGMGDNTFSQIADSKERRFYDEPFRFDLKVVKCATWNNLSMALTSDGKCFIWGKYGQIEFPSVRVKITIDKRKVNQSTQVNFLEEISENFESNVQPSCSETTEQESNRISNSLKSAQTSFTVVEDEQEFNVETLTTNFLEKKYSVNEEENSDKKSEEKQKIRELIANGKVEYHKLELTLKNPKEIKCKSFAKIIAKRFEEINISLESDLSNHNQSDDYENDLIDFRDFIVVIYEYEEIVEQVEEKDDKKEKEQSEKLKKLEERLETLEKNKPTVQNIHVGNQTKTVLFNKSSVSEVDGFLLSGINQTGTSEEVKA